MSYATLEYRFNGWSMEHHEVDYYFSMEVREVDYVHSDPAPQPYRAECHPSG